MVKKDSSGKPSSLDAYLLQAVKNKILTLELAEVILGISSATKTVAEAVNGAAISSLLGQNGNKNVQGEEVQKLDEFADEIFVSKLNNLDSIHSMISEEREHVIPGTAKAGSGKYVVAFDPLDGSSNIDVNVSIGSIWGIYAANGVPIANEPEQFLKPGHEQLAAGYSIYGSSTMLVLSIGHGVHGFTLSSGTGEFVLTHPSMKVPEGGKIYSCNEGNSGKWSEGVRRYIEFLKSSGEGNDRRPYSHRYVGSLVADFHRTMLKGGIFLYPADSKNKSGKLRLLYECAPLSFLVEQAGGKSTNGRRPILSLVPEKIHQRSPLFIGSSSMVDQLDRFLKMDE